MNLSNRLYALGFSAFFQVLWLLVFGTVLVGAVLVGAVILSGLLGAAAIVAIAFYLRMGWLKRRLGRRQRRRPAGPPPRGELIHAEYIVVSERPMPRGRWD